MFNFKTTLRWAIIGGVAVIVTALVLGQLVLKLFLPFLTEQLDVFNLLALILVTVIPVMFFVNLILMFAHWSLRVFSNVKYEVIDGLIPIMSDIKARQQYMDLVGDEFTEGNGHSKASVGFIKFLGNLLVVMPLLFYASVFGWGAYIYFTLGMFMFTETHIMWIFVSLFLYTLYIGVNTVCVGISAYSLNGLIRSFNPKSLVIAPCLIPLLSIGYVVVVILGMVTGNALSIGLLNVIAMVGTPVINPFIALMQATRAVKDSKITVDESRRQAQESPIIW